MARGVCKLTATAVAKMKAPGRYADGGGLYLQVGPTGTKAWLFRFMRRGQAREMGLGSVGVVSLARARELAAEARTALHLGKDPIEERDKARQETLLAEARGMTFAQCAEAYIAAHRDSWRNAKHAAQWTSTLKAYAEPVFGTLPVQAVDLALVMKVLEPIWRAKPETASRLRGRIESILDWATVREYRQGENPARWKGHLDKLLPARAKVQKVEHHPALPYGEIGDFMAALRGQEGTAARALEFAILTAARTGEAIGARWSEIDLAAKLWIVPAERMKAGREHRVPLSGRTVGILQAMAELRPSDDDGSAHVFPGAKPKRPLSNMAFLMLLRRMKRPDLTAHGFRSTFRDWAAERTAFAREVAEAALAHVVGDKVEAAYRRGDLFEKRRRLMEAWAGYCATKSATGVVVALKAAQ